VQWAIKEKNVRFQIMACTDSEREIAWLNQFDQDFDAVDVTDDFESEKQEILSKGHFNTFSRADWIMKALLGAVDSRFDSLDEAPCQPTMIREPEAKDSNKAPLQNTCKQEVRDSHEVITSVVKGANISPFDQTKETPERHRADKKSACSPECAIC